MAKSEQLDLKLPAAILALGQMLPSPRGWGPRGGATSPEQAAAQEERILTMLRSDAGARRVLGMRDSVVGTAANRVQLRAFAYLARRMLRESTRGGADMAEVAIAASDATSEPEEALLVARDAVGRMVSAGALEARPDGQCPWNPTVILPARSLQWVCGGRSSHGLLLPQRLATARMKGGNDPELDDVVVPAPLSARAIRERMAERVVGMEDGQLDVVSARLSMHMTRARMLASGNDPGTPNEVVLVMGAETTAARRRGGSTPTRSLGPRRCGPCAWWPSTPACVLATARRYCGAKSTSARA